MSNSDDTNKTNGTDDTNATTDTSSTTSTNATTDTDDTTDINNTTAGTPQTRATLDQLFADGQRPDGQDFADSFASTLNILDDGIYSGGKGIIKISDTDNDALTLSKNEINADTSLNIICQKDDIKITPPDNKSVMINGTNGNNQPANLIVKSNQAAITIESDDDDKRAFLRVGSSDAYWDIGKQGNTESLEFRLTGDEGSQIMFDRDGITVKEITINGTPITGVDTSISMPPTDSTKDTVPTTNAVQGLVMNNVVPVGSVMMYAGPIDEMSGTNLEQQGWTVCDGRQLNAQSDPQWQELYDAIGNTYGGTSNQKFYLPDCRGMFVRGVNQSTTNDPDAESRGAQMTGGKTGDSVGTRQNDEFKKHYHSIQTTESSQNKYSLSWLFKESRVIKDIVNTSESGGAETRPVNIAFYYIIKYKQVNSSTNS